MTQRTVRRRVSPGAALARATLLVAAFAAPLFAVTIPTVPLGNAGNAGDTEVMNDNTTGYGAVAYNYRIGTTEVTNEQYAAFLNEKARSWDSDPLALYDGNMFHITRSGGGSHPILDPYVYTVNANMGNKPVVWVSWYDAIRFTNWLHNGQGAGDTETGAYTLLGGTPIPSNADSIARNEGAKWWLPSEDEWYKAAYYDPTLSAGAGGYWNYATRSDSAPTTATVDSVGNISNPGANVANYKVVPDGESGQVTSVGSAGPLSESYYGTADQTGNLWEWNETPIVAYEPGDEELIEVIHRGVRGGAYEYVSFPEIIAASFRFHADPFFGFGSASVGFRVATVAVVPEPSTWTHACAAVMLTAAFAGIVRWKKGKRFRTAVVSE